jgi:GxxExxY protein
MTPHGEALTHLIIEAIIKVHRTLGPGFLEGIYQRALVHELNKQGLPISTETEVVIRYDDQPIGRHRLDLIVAEEVIVELKTVEFLTKVHYAQVRSYLKATGLPVALLVNFSTDKADYRRIENG